MGPPDHALATVKAKLVRRAKRLKVPWVDARDVPGFAKEARVHNLFSLFSQLVVVEDVQGATVKNWLCTGYKKELFNMWGNVTLQKTGAHCMLTAVFMWCRGYKNLVKLSQGLGLAGAENKVLGQEGLVVRYPGSDPLKGQLRGQVKLTLDVRVQVKLTLDVHVQVKLTGVTCWLGKTCHCLTDGPVERTLKSKLEGLVECITPVSRPPPDVNRGIHCHQARGGAGPAPWRPPAAAQRVVGLVALHSAGLLLMGRPGLDPGGRGRRAAPLQQCVEVPARRLLLSPGSARLLNVLYPACGVCLWE